jgi:AAA15 family ATPase/GTPase
MKEIEEEYLYAYYSVKPTTIFERKGNNYEFKTDKKELEFLKNRNTPNKLFLATATAWNYVKTKTPYLWFASLIDTYSGNDWNTDYQVLMDDENRLQKNFIIELLKIADINISDYHIKETDIPREQNQSKGISITTLHETVEDNKTNFWSLDMKEESAGTQHLFAMSTHMKRAFETGKIMVVDQLDAELHPLLMEEIVRMFHNPEINKKNAQLIFTTHGVNILNLDIMRRDQIYFVEKNANTAVSELFSLDEFSVRKSENIRSGYLLGRYGAIPLVLQGGSPWQ